MGNGEFEGLSVEALRAMLANADPDKLTAVGTALGDAGPKILDIGSDLRRHVSRVEWTGEGGSAFREWAHDFALEVMRFGQFTSTVGQHVAQAGQALSETKSAMPESRDPKAAHEDPAAQEAARRDTEEAKHQMERLSSAYRAAQETMAAEREPQFKLLPGLDRIDSYYPSEASGTTEGDSVPSMGARARLTAANSTDDSSANAGQQPDPVPADRQSLGTTIDSTTAVPKPGTHAPAELVTPVADPPKQSASDLGPITPGMSRAPAPVPSRPSMRGGGSGTVRPPLIGRSHVGTEGTPIRPVVPRSSPGGDLIGGQPRPGGDSSRTRLPRGMVVGEEHAPMSRGPMTGGTNRVPGTGGPAAEGMPAGRRLASEPGGQVSGPRMPTSNSSANPRRAAIGEERGATGRAPAPGIARPSTSVGTAGASGDTTTERRLASETGGSVADTRTSPRRRAEFTRGGTGLVRSEDNVSPIRTEARGSNANRRRTEHGRENASGGDGSWPLGRRDAVPPVVE